MVFLKDSKCKAAFLLSKKLRKRNEQPSFWPSLLVTRIINIPHETNIPSQLLLREHLSCQTITFINQYPSTSLQRRFVFSFSRTKCRFVLVRGKKYQIFFCESNTYFFAVYFKLIAINCFGGHVFSDIKTRMCLSRDFDSFARTDTAV